jgi:hypothetical protein
MERREKPQKIKHIDGWMEEGKTQKIKYMDGWMEQGRGGWMVSRIGYIELWNFPLGSVSLKTAKKINNG